MGYTYCRQVFRQCFWQLGQQAGCLYLPPTCQTCNRATNWFAPNAVRFLRAGVLVQSPVWLWVCPKQPALRFRGANCSCAPTKCLVPIVFCFFRGTSFCWRQSIRAGCFRFCWARIQANPPHQPNELNPLHQAKTQAHRLPFHSAYLCRLCTTIRAHWAQVPHGLRPILPHIESATN